MSEPISRELLGKIVDEVFDGAIEDASVIEQIYASIKKHEAPSPSSHVVSDEIMDRAVDAYHAAAGTSADWDGLAAALKTVLTPAPQPNVELSACCIGVVRAADEITKDLGPADFCTCRERNCRDDRSLRADDDSAARRDACDLLPIGQCGVDASLPANAESADDVRMGDPVLRASDIYVPHHSSGDWPAVTRIPAPPTREGEGD